MRKIKAAVFVFLLALIPHGAVGEEAVSRQEAKQESAAYEVTDIKNNKLLIPELWTYKVVPEKYRDFDDEDQIYEEEHITKEPFGKKDYKRTEIRKRQWNETSSATSLLYFKEVIAPIITSGEKGTHIFGHVEAWRKSDGQLIATWPVFYEFSQKDGSVMVTSTSYLPGDVVAWKVKVCDQNDCALPVQEEDVLMRGESVLSYILFKRK